MYDITQLVRPHILDLKPYSSARSEFSGKANIWIDANENPYETGLNRYPDPLQKELKRRISIIKNVPAENIFLGGGGSDEAIDLLIRCFCTPQQDAILTFPPTYGMYGVIAEINQIKILECPLNSIFQINLHTTKSIIAANKNLKMLFICSPNNPTGNSENIETIRQICVLFDGIVVVDEAYIDFCPEKSVLPYWKELPNLVVLQTFSKAWGLAGIRLGMALASPEIISLLTKIKLPYNVNQLTINQALKDLNNEAGKDKKVSELIAQREKLCSELVNLSFIDKIFPSQTNFILFRASNSQKLYQYLTQNGVIVRDRHSAVPNSLRVTIGTPEENQQLINLLKKWEKLI